MLCIASNDAGMEAPWIRSQSTASTIWCESTTVLVIDDDYYMRKVIRSLLLAVGIKDVHEAANGVAGLEAIRRSFPISSCSTGKCRS